MNENVVTITEGVRQSLDATQKNALNVADLVRETGNLSGKAQHDCYMQRLIDSPMRMKERQKYMDHERRVYDRYVNRNFKRVEHMQRTQTQNTNHVSYGWIGVAAVAGLGIAACTPQGRTLISKAWKCIRTVPALA